MEENAVIESTAKYIKEQIRHNKIVYLDQFRHILGDKRARKRIEKRLDTPFVWGYFAPMKRRSNDGWYLELLE